MASKTVNKEKFIDTTTQPIGDVTTTNSINAQPIDNVTTTQPDNSSDTVIRQRINAQSDSVTTTNSINTQPDNNSDTVTTTQFDNNSDTVTTQPTIIDETNGLNTDCSPHKKRLDFKSYINSLVEIASKYDNCGCHTQDEPYNILYEAFSN